MTENTSGGIITENVSQLNETNEIEDKTASAETETNEAVIQKNEAGDEYGSSLYDEEDYVQYARYDGKEAVKILFPSEAEETFEPKEKSVSKKAHRQKKELDLQGFFSYFIGQIPSFVEHTGELTIKLVSTFFSKYGALLALPFVVLFSALKKLFIHTKASVKGMPKNLSDDIKGIKFEIRTIKKQIKNMENKSHFTYIKAMRKYLVISFSRHKVFWQSVFNVIFPAVAAVVLLVFFNANNNKIIALEVLYNNISVGYVESEAVFENAKTHALELLPVDVESDTDYKQTLGSEPVYKISRIEPSELSNEAMVCEKLIERSDASLLRACGIYVDGEFLCAVQSESDAISVFDAILAPYEKRAAKGTIVAFVEEITYEQRLYPESSIWDTLTLKKTLSQPKSKAEYYKAKKGETAKQIAKKFSISVSELKALNGSVNFSKLKKGTRLLVSPESNYVRVKVMKTRTKTQTIPFETIKKNSSSLTKGTTKTSQEGRNGKYVITELVTYIDGKETYSTVVSKKQTVAPVNKIVLVGTKVISYYNDYYNGGGYPSYSSKFIWPTRGAYRISSYYGYRNPSISGWGFHGGIDIVRSGGGSTGCPIVACASGTVVTAISGYSGYGHTVVIDHGNGLRTRYAHMQAGSLMVRVGQRVYQGQQIGRLGGTGNVTGPHLHFEVLRNGVKVNPLPYIS